MTYNPYKHGHAKPPPSKTAIKAHLDFLNLGNQDDESIPLDFEGCVIPERQERDKCIRCGCPVDNSAGFDTCFDCAAKI